MSHTYQNLRGTTSKEFSIGKYGVTLYTLDTLPDNTLGENGKSYCFVNGDKPKLLYKSNNTWSEINAASVLNVNATQTIEIYHPRTFISVDSSSGSVTLTIEEMPTSGYEIIVNDKLGFASSNNITLNIEIDSVVVDSHVVTADNGTLRLMSLGNELSTY